MKTKSNFLLFLFMTFFAMNSYCQTDTLREGIYETKEDFLNKKVKYVGEFKNCYAATAGRYFFIFKDEKTKKEVKYHCKNSPYWGFRDNHGVDYMVDKDKNGWYLGILEYGKIMVWSNEISWFKDDKGQEQESYALGSYFWVSKGLDGERVKGLTMGIKDQLVTWFSEDDKELADKVKKEKFPAMDDKRVGVVRQYITFYNQRHPVK